MNTDKFNEELTPDEELRAQNEIEALKIEMMGGKTFIADDAPPELVAQFFRNINMYESSKENYITIEELIGKPRIKKENEILSNDEFQKECEKLHQMFDENNIEIVKPKFKSWKDWHHFLVHTFLTHEVVSIKDKSYHHHFDYNDFFEDDPDFILMNVHDELGLIFDLKDDYEGLWIEDIESNENADQIVNHINSFRMIFNDLELVKYNPNTVRENGKYHKLTFDIEWKGVRAGTLEREYHKGKGSAELYCEDLIWRIHSMSIPGLEF
jgi:hypothetical protein